jgi:glutaredoxin-related protein
MNIIAKWLIFIVLITILIAGTSIYFNYKVKKTSDTLSIHMDKIREYTLKDEWEKASDEFKNIEQNWGNGKNFWMLTINHNEVDEISLSMAKLKEFITSREKTHVFSELAFLKQLVTNIVDNRRYTLSNML